MVSARPSVSLNRASTVLPVPKSTATLAMIIVLVIMFSVQ